MSSVENLDEFHAKLNHIVNLNYNLGETIKEPKIVRKILRYLSEQFDQVTSIEERVRMSTPSR